MVPGGPQSSRVPAPITIAVPTHQGTEKAKISNSEKGGVESAKYQGEGDNGELGHHLCPGCQKNRLSVPFSAGYHGRGLTPGAWDII